MKKTIYVVVRLEVEINDNETTVDDVVSEADYEFKSTIPNTNIVDTEIVGSDEECPLF